MTTSIIISGFGGQGILFAGKLLAISGMLIDKKVSWLPSYGPEMRGGTANCQIIISDKEIASPIVDTPDVLIAMNKPSFDKFFQTVKKNGLIISDSCFSNETDREDITSVSVPVKTIAEQNKIYKLDNMIMVGTFAKILKIFDVKDIISGIKKLVSVKKENLLEINEKMIMAGFNYNY